MFINDKRCSILTGVCSALLLLLVLAESVLAQSEPLRPGMGQPLILEHDGQQIEVSVYIDGLIAPWDIEVLADLPSENSNGAPAAPSMIVSESTGTLRLIRAGNLVEQPIWQAPSPDGNDVLHGVVVHPDFANNGWVYAAYTKEAEAGLTLAISRGVLRGDQLRDVEEIFVADAWESAANGMAGRMLFGPDNTLYVTVGDRDRLCCGAVDDTSIRILAQQLDNHLGKTLRLDENGRAPADNPFVGRADAKPEVFTYGNRNGYGLDFHPETGELWQVEIGPMGGDEINILIPGGNYGWPLLSMGLNYSGTHVSEQPWWREGMQMPRMFWVPAISPSSIMFYTGAQFPEWQGNLFVTSLSGQEVQRIGLGLPGQAERRSPMLSELGLRFRDVAQDADGYLYFATETRYGSGSADGSILKIAPAASSPGQ